MKDRIVALLKYHEKAARDRAKFLISYEITNRLIQEAKAEAFEQAIAIVEEVMKE